jgi:hypothetical protein
MNAHILDIVRTPVKCEICHLLREIILRNITVHVLETVHSPVMCVICHSLRGVILRYINAHAGDRPFSCVDCDKYMRVWMFSRNVTSQSEERPYCEVWNKLFTHDSSMKTHQSIQNGERLHVWCVCNKLCNHNIILKIRIYSGEHAYCWAVCYRSFYHVSSLKKHLHTYWWASIF